jgi:ubiquitin carboxyl-terminal hydrolase 7
MTHNFSFEKTIDNVKELITTPFVFDYETSDKTKYDFRIGVDSDNNVKFYVSKAGDNETVQIKIKVRPSVGENYKKKQKIVLENGKEAEIDFGITHDKLLQSDYVTYGAMTFNVNLKTVQVKSGEITATFEYKEGQKSYILDHQTVNGLDIKISLVEKGSGRDSIFIYEFPYIHDQRHINYTISMCGQSESGSKNTCGKEKIDLGAPIKDIFDKFSVDGKIDITFKFEISEADNSYSNTNSNYTGTSYSYQNSNYNYNYNYSYNTREETGFVGLQNQGATCYMNSLLQSLFNLPAFRKIVYEMPTTGTEDEKKSIPLNLQRLFCQMQLGKEACSTKALTTSFGWGSTETFMQHDIEEFNRVLLDNLETKLKGTQLETAIADLFKGQYRNYIKCKNVDFKSSRVEDFYDLQMVVRGCKDLEASFKLYTATDELVGDNQYQAGEFGKQDAEMGIEFVKFPTILQLHLNRFEYDYNYDRMVKINDKFEFPEEIDLSKFLSDDADKSVSAVYTLFGVLVHSGSADFGHYYAFLRPSTDEQWFEFNDSRVSKVTKDKAISDNFGGESENAYSYSSYYSSYYSSGKSYSGYMLVYVRKDAAQNIFQPIPDEAVPKHLIDYMNRPKEPETSYYDSLDVTVMTEENFAETTLSTEKIFSGLDKQVKFQMEKKKTTNTMVYAKVAETLGVDVNEIRLWKQASYYNTPNTFIPNNDEKVDAYWSLNVFVQKKAKEEELELKSNEIIVYTKFFFSEDEYKLQYTGTFKMSKESPLTALCDEVNKKMGFPEGTQLVVFTESCDKKAAKIDSLSSSLDALLVSTGSVLIFQLEDKKLESTTTFVKKTLKDFVKEDSENKDAKTSIKTQESTEIDVPSFTYTDDEDSELTVAKYFILNNEILKFYLTDFNDITKIIAKISFTTDVKFDNLFKFIASIAKLDYDPTKNTILLYAADYYNPDKPRSEHIDVTYYKTPKTVLYQSYTGTKKLFFQFIPDCPLEQLSLFTPRRIIFFEDGMNPVFDKSFLIPKGTTKVKEIADYLIKKEIIKEGDYDYIKIYRNDIEEFYKPDSEIQYTCYDLRIQPVKVPHNKALIISRGVMDRKYNTFTATHPSFLYEFDKEKSKEDILKELKEICGYNDKEFTSIRLMYKPKGEYYPKAIPEGEFSEIIKPGDVLYLIGRSAKRAAATSNESLKIYN